MTAERITNPVDLLLLQENNGIPEGKIRFMDVSVCKDGSAYIDMGIDSPGKKLDHILLQVSRGCLRKVDNR